MILIVEDNADIAEMFKIAIEREDIAQCFIVTSAVAALAWIAHKSWRLILLDIGLRGHLDGNDVLREMARCGYNHPVIVMTGDSMTFDRSLYPGIRLILRKPVSPKELVTLIREHMTLNGENHGAGGLKREGWFKRVWQAIRGTGNAS